MKFDPGHDPTYLGNESFDLPGLILFGRYQFSASQFELRPHSHRGAIEICFLEKGEQSYRVGGLIYRMRGNDQFFTLPGEVHDTGNLPQERGALYWLILDMKGTRRLLGLSERQASRLKRALSRMPHRHFRAHPDCLALLAQIFALAKDHRTGAEPLRSIQLQALLLHYLSLTLAAAYAGTRGLATPLMQRVIQYVEKHLHDPVHVPRLAQTARLSESRLKARFKQELGVPPAEFWLRRKVERAAVLLRSKTATEVAHELGFSSSQYFATVMKRYTLKTPTHFRASGLAK